MIEETKNWFEQNYIDGDKIQDGQMLSSQECLDAVLELQSDLISSILKELPEEDNTLRYS